MRELAKGVFYEDRYPGVQLGAVVSDGDALLVDTPLRMEDGRSWQAEVAERGRARYLALLDDHPDRVYGARSFDLGLIAHRLAREAIVAWPDPVRAGHQLQGAEVDRLKRVSGLARAVPHVGFDQELTLHLGGRMVTLLHRPGPRPGSIWVVVPWARVVFVGDAVWIREPPYVGEADLDPWLEALSELRSREFARYKIVSARDGLVRREALNKMAGFLRKVAHRVEKLGDRDDPAAAAGRLAVQLARGFRVAAARREQAQLRLRTGLEQLYNETYADG